MYVIKLKPWLINVEHIFLHLQQKNKHKQIKVNILFNEKLLNLYIYLGDDLFLLKQTLTDDNQQALSRKKTLSHNRRSSATDPDQPISTFESLSINTELTNNKKSRETSPNLRPRRFSGDIVLPPSSSEITEPSLFSPGSVRARTISSLQENKTLSSSSSLPKRQNSLSTPPIDPPSPSKRLDIRLSSGKTVNTSDFIHSDDQHPYLINPHIEMSYNQEQPPPQQNQLSNETTRNKLLQSVYINNTNPNPSSSLSESLTNGTNSHTHATESSSNCVLS